MILQVIGYVLVGLIIVLYTSGCAYWVWIMHVLTKGSSK